jgi:hypothetical protein
MATKINNSTGAATNGDKPVTFEGAEDLGAFELASRAADRLSWPMPLNRSAIDDPAGKRKGSNAAGRRDRRRSPGWDLPGHGLARNVPEA